MSELSQTSGRPQASTNNKEPQPEANTIHPSTTRAQHRKSSPPLDHRGEVTKPAKPRRRPGTTTKTPSGPHAGPSRSQQRSSVGPANMLPQTPSVNYTRTGRISKAKKGLKVHNCECGRSYTRAEHLRRHQKNHAQEDALICDYTDCGKVFYRLDLLHRHQERHNETGNNMDPSEFTPEHTPEVMVETTQSMMMPTTMPTEPIRVAQSYPVPASPMQDVPVIPRYTIQPFRTPQLPRSARLPSSGFISQSSPISSPNPKQHMTYGHHRPRSIPVSVDGVNSYGWGVEPYSPSSGYGSPSLGPNNDYTGLFPHPGLGHGFNRTRTPSNASVNDPWSMTPQSPSSSISTMPAYTWAPSDKITTAQSLAYITTSYPMTTLGVAPNVEVTAGYGQFDPKTMMQRDQEEAAFLFRDQPYGMGQVVHTYPSEQYLNNYWRLFHPTFPVVHRSTFGSMSSSPMLCAAMLAIDGQYSNDTSVKRNSRLLHDRCIKLLRKRECEPVAEDHRLCDHQSVFLVEVLSQYYARRAAKTLSPQFGTLYHKAAANFRQTTSNLAGIVDSLAQTDNVTLTRWLQWIELATWQRLLVSCYILESQQSMLLAREPGQSAFPESGIDLPFPVHTSVWDAVTITEWAAAAQQHVSSPQYVFEVTQEPMLLPCDPFQSSVLVAAHYTGLDATPPYSSAPLVSEIDHLVDKSHATRQTLLVAKMLQVTPVRALLAVSGESWILSEKVSSPQVFTAFKTTLYTWVSQLWSAPTTSSQPVASREALRISVDLLQLAMEKRSETPELAMGLDMGVYFASLVLWAVTTAASTRASDSQSVMHHLPYRHNSQPPSLDTYHGPLSMPSTPVQMSTSFPTSFPAVTSSPTPAYQSLPNSPTRHDSLCTTTLLSHDQIAYTAMDFLPTVLAVPQQSFDLAALQAGCISLLLWVKLQLRGKVSEPQTDLTIWASRQDDGLGELANSLVGTLERVLNRGWGGWGF